MNPVSVMVATPSDRTVIVPMLDQCLAELSRYRKVEVGPSSSEDYPYLEVYWRDPGRHAFLIQQGERYVGFALVRHPDAENADLHEMAEFFIRADSRRLGIGRRAAISILERLGGRWQLDVQLRNAPGLRFWKSCIADVTGRPPRTREVESADGRRVAFSFGVPDPV